MRRAALVTVLVVAGFLVASAAGAQTTPDVSGYAWASACKDCHAKHFDAWEKTKHATAIRRLGGDERQKDCINCHVTGPKQLLEKDVNANIQCEECHGPGKAHIEAASADNAKPGHIVRKPAEKMCVDCHSAKSPHFKFFSYAALEPLIHQVPK